MGGALPRALAHRGHDVRLLLPHYPWVGQGDPVRTVALPLGSTTEPVRLLRHGGYRGVDVYSVGNGTHFDRERIYGYGDDDARFILFSKAVAAFASGPGWTPDVVHVNDWHLGLVPQLLSASRPRTVLTIHNAGLQGPWRPEQRALIGPRDRFRGNLLARGILHADRVNTVSRRYLEEILTPEQGMGLHRMLRARRGDLTGILNGVDAEEFDPARDRWIAARYDPRSLERKRLNKLVLQGRSDLVLDPEVPVLAMVARLVGQKGVDLLVGALDELVRLGVQVVVAGVGERRFREALEAASAANRGRVAHHPSDDEALARLVYAGSDLFLAPSNYEPCGLAPLIALRYGTIPVVRHTGGLAETVPGFGFGFRGRSVAGLVGAVRDALAVYRRRADWAALQRRAMAAGFSWDAAAEAYELLYVDAIRFGRSPLKERPLA